MTRTWDSSPPIGCAVVSVGNELLFGETLDTNGFWLSGGLSELGFSVVGRRVVGDDEARIREAVRWALETAEVVLVTGGLGPTPDDMTRDSVAAELDLPLTTDPCLLEGLQARFQVRGFGTLPKRSRKMAEVPAGARVFPNPQGAAPGLALEVGDGRICVLLPGVPSEMREICQSGVFPFLKERFSDSLRPAVHRLIHTFGIPESILMAEIQESLGGEPESVTMAYLPDHLGVRLRLTAHGPTEAEAQADLQRMEDLLAPVLRGYRYEAESGDLAEAVGRGLVERGETIAVAESCTGGLLSKRHTDLPGSSRYFLGGIAAYANEAKVRLLGVPGELIESDGVVSESVAEAMAVGVARGLGASMGVGITGIAGPSGGSEEKPVGLVCYALFSEGSTILRRERFLGDRREVRERAAHAVLGLILRTLRGRPR